MSYSQYNKVCTQQVRRDMRRKLIAGWQCRCAKNCTDSFQSHCDVLILTMTSDDIAMSLYNTNRTFRAMSLTSGVRVFDRGFLHHLILWSLRRLSDGLRTRSMSSMMASLYAHVIRIFRVFMMTRTSPNSGSLICAQLVYNKSYVSLLYFSIEYLITSVPV